MKKVGVVLISFFFIVVAIFAIFYFNVSKTLGSSEFYKSILQETNAYERFLETDPKFFVKIIDDVFGGNPESEDAKYVQEDVQNIISRAKPETVKTLVESCLSQVFDGVLSGKSNIILLDLGSIKSEISSDDEITKKFVQEIPDKYELSVGETNKPLSLLYVSKNFSYVLLALSLIILLVGLFALINGWGKRLQALGIILFVISFPVFASAVSILYIVPLKFSVYPEISDLVIDILTNAREKLFLGILYQSVGIAIFAIIVFIVSIFLIKKEKIRRI